MITAANLSKRYGRFTAIRDVSFDLETGATLVVTGPNGSGKTTLLRLLAGISRPTNGQVTLGGNHPRSMRSRIGFVGHDPYLYPFLTVSENLEFFARLYGADQGAVDEWIQKLNVIPKKGIVVGSLSRGETQRVSLARCLLHHPDYLFADEPMSGLDSETASQLPAWLKSAGRTLVVATHDSYFAEQLEGISLRLESGRIKA